MIVVTDRKELGGHQAQPAARAGESPQREGMPRLQLILHLILAKRSRSDNGKGTEDTSDWRRPLRSAEEIQANLSGIILRIYHVRQMVFDLLLLIHTPEKSVPLLYCNNNAVLHVTRNLKQHQ